jgi:cytochrome c oxidase subunit 2
VRGEPHDWQMGFQPAATDITHETFWFHNDVLMPIIVVISVLVAGLMAYVLVKFRAKANPVPSKNAHNTTIEVLWTVVPTIVVAIIGIISVRLVYFQDAPPEDLAAYSGHAPEANEVVLKVTGNRWYWEYEYPEEEISYASILVEDADLKPGEPRLLTVDNPVVIPVNTVVRLQVTANPQDVIHAWTIPSFGVKVDAVPGRLNERWFRVLPGMEGRYHGQCSELCGMRHAYMPITVDVVSVDEYNAWLAQQKGEASASPVEAQPTTVALGEGHAE